MISKRWISHGTNLFDGWLMAKKKAKVNPEYNKMAQQAIGYGWDIDVATIEGMDDDQRSAFDKYLQGMDRNEDPLVPAFLLPVDDEAEAEAIGQSHVVGVDEHGDEIFDELEPVVAPESVIDSTPGLAGEIVAGEAVAAPIEPSELESLRKTVANLQRQIEYMPLLTPRQQEALEVAEEVGTLSQTVAKAEEKYSDADKAAKAAKKAYESLLQDLQDAAQRLDDITGTGDYQRSLFNQPYRGVSHDELAAVAAIPVDTAVEPAKPHDVGGAIRLDDLTKAGLTTHVEHDKPGLTTKKIEALVETVGGTVRDLEAWLQAGNQLNTIKGFGDEWVTRTMDALGVIRDRYPVPSVNEPDEPTAGAVAVLEPSPDEPTDSVAVDTPVYDDELDESHNLEPELATV